MPHGPASAGPMRFCMSPMSLRSNQIISMTATIRMAKAATTLMIRISASSRPKPPM